jgi:hypothetical protein
MTAPSSGAWSMISNMMNSFRPSGVQVSEVRYQVSDAKRAMPMPDA